MSVTYRRVLAAYGNFMLLDMDQDAPIRLVDETTGLVVTYPAGGLVLTGIDTGTVNVAVEARRSAPHDVDERCASEWEEIVEVDVVSLSGNLRVFSPFEGDSQHPALTEAGPGTYRLRAFARGRDVPGERFDVDSDEHYLLVCWPAPASHTALIKVTDAVGRANRSIPGPSSQVT